MTDLSLDNSVFSCEVLGSVAVVRLKEHALDLTTDLEAREQYTEVLYAIERDDGISGLVELNTATFPGSEVLREFLKSLGGGDQRDRARTGMQWSRLRWAITEMALTRAKFAKPFVVGLDDECSSDYLGVALTADCRIATSNTRVTFTNREVGFPLSPVLAFYLRNLMTPAQAGRLWVECQALSAQQLEALGLIESIVDAGDLQSTCITQVETLSEISGHLYAANKGMLKPDPEDLERYLNRAFDSIRDMLLRTGRANF